MVSKIFSLASTYLREFLELDSYDSSIWQLSKQGEGVIIGVLYSGIVPTHPSFDDKGMPAPPKSWHGCCEVNGKICDGFTGKPCNNKLITAVSIGSPGHVEDTEGHGTMCASLAARSPVDGAEFVGQAKGTATGVAPKAHIAVYKVCSPNCGSMYILKGADRAILDGVHLLSISMSRPGKFHETHKGTFVVMERGVLPVAAASNVGATGIANCIENDLPWMLTVGASSMDRSITATLKLGNGMEFDGQTAYQPSHWDDSVMRPIVFPGINFTRNEDLNCDREVLSKLDIKGKIVVCVAEGFQGMTAIKRGELVKELGGVGIILFNLPISGGMTTAEPHVLPAVRINHTDSLKMQSYFKTESNPVATIVFKGTLFHTPRAPAVGSWSCRGPSKINGGILKPDVIAPGVNVLTAWHEEVGPIKTHTDKPFNYEMGTSVSTPIVAGVVAMLKGIYPDWSPAAIKSAIMTTAHFTDKTGMPIHDMLSKTLEPASFYAMGAGHVNPPGAVNPGLIYDTAPDDYIPYLCGLGYTDEQIYVITKRRVSCQTTTKLSVEKLNYPSISVSGLNARKKFIVPRNVMNVGESNSKYVVEIKEPDGVSTSVEPQTLEFDSNIKQMSFQVEIIGKAHNGKQKGSYSEGHIIWKDGKHTVRSPVLVEF